MNIIRYTMIPAERRLDKAAAARDIDHCPTCRARIEFSQTAIAGFSGRLSVIGTTFFPEPDADYAASIYAGQCGTCREYAYYFEYRFSLKKNVLDKDWSQQFKPEDETSYQAVIEPVFQCPSWTIKRLTYRGGSVARDRLGKHIDIHRIGPFGLNATLSTINGARIREIRGEGHRLLKSFGLQAIMHLREANKDNRLAA